MYKYNIRPKYSRRKRNPTYKRIEANVKPNLVKRNFNVNEENCIWTTDITYLIFNGKRAYLSTILDLCNRKIVAYKISRHNDINLVIDTLNEAIAKRKDVHGLIIHSDQGFQYTSYEYKAICESNGIQISMSRKGTPIDDWIYKYKKQGNLDNDINHKRGRKKDNEIDYKEKYEILKKYQAFIKAQREKK